jgi:Na+/H+ antiporter NhaD/arsenite permease-like protein
MNPTTGPLIGVLFLLAITAIGRQEVKEGTLGANNINPMDIMAFALTIGYMSSAIDASGLIRYLTFKILQRYGGVGHRLFILLYVAFFAIGCLFGNDPVIQMGMLLLTYMVRMSSNIVHPRAWLHTQFAISNIASAIFVSSNTTNVVIAQAFKIGFAEYTANIIVPVMAAVVLLPPFLLYIFFADESLIPFSIKMHQLPEEENARKPVSPNIPFEDFESVLFEHDGESARTNRLSLSEVMNPFLDKASAAFGVALMFTTLVVLLALTAANLTDVPVFWATLPAAFIMLCWDIVFGWVHRHETREISRRHRFELEKMRAERAEQACRDADRAAHQEATEQTETCSTTPANESCIMLSGAINSEVNATVLDNQREDTLDGSEALKGNSDAAAGTLASGVRDEDTQRSQRGQHDASVATETQSHAPLISGHAPPLPQPDRQKAAVEEGATSSSTNLTPESHNVVQNTAKSKMDCADERNGTRESNACIMVENTPDVEQPESRGSEGRKDIAQLTTIEEEAHAKSEASIKRTTSRADNSVEAAPKEVEDKMDAPNEVIPSPTGIQRRTTLATLLSRLWRWSQETFPQVSAVLAHLPFSLILFVFPTFILVQSLVSTGWVTALAHGWDGWVEKTGTVGAIAGMGLLSVLLSNVSPSFSPAALDL